MALKVAVVGLGPRGQDWLREVKNAPAFELAAAVDVDPHVLQQTARNGVSPKQCFNDLRAALDQIRCDAVIVATSVDAHVQPCELALQHGLPVMVEKPFALSLREAAMLVSLAEQNNVPLIVAQNYRYMRSFRTARRLIAEGRLGRLGMATCQYYRVPQKIAASLARLENSALWGAGIHHLDALRYVLNKPVSRVLSEQFTLPWGKLPRGGSMQTMLWFAEEIPAFYSASYESTGHEFFERGQEFYLRFVGEKATLHVFQRWLILCESGRLPRIVRRGPRKFSEERTLLDQLEQAMLHGTPADSSGRDNLHTIAIVEACLRSAASRSWIQTEELPDD